MILMVDGAHHDEGHQKQKLREKKQPLRGNFSSQKWLLCIASTISKNSKL
jgi:hypothetical protein